MELSQLFTDACHSDILLRVLGLLSTPELNRVIQVNKTTYNTFKGSATLQLKYQQIRCDLPITSATLTPTLTTDEQIARLLRRERNLDRLTPARTIAFDFDGDRIASLQSGMILTTGMYAQAQALTANSRGDTTKRAGWTLWSWSEDSAVEGSGYPLKVAQVKWDRRIEIAEMCVEDNVIFVVEHDITDLTTRKVYVYELQQGVDRHAQQSGQPGEGPERLATPHPKAAMLYIHIQALPSMRLGQPTIQALPGGYVAIEIRDMACTLNEDLPTIIGIWDWQRGVCLGEIRERDFINFSYIRPDIVVASAQPSFLDLEPADQPFCLNTYRVQLADTSSGLQASGEKNDPSWRLHADKNDGLPWCIGQVSAAESAVSYLFPPVLRGARGDYTLVGSSRYVGKPRALRPDRHLKMEEKPTGLVRFGFEIRGPGIISVANEDEVTEIEIRRYVYGVTGVLALAKVVDDTLGKDSSLRGFTEICHSEWSRFADIQIDQPHISSARFRSRVITLAPWSHKFTGGDDTDDEDRDGSNAESECGWMSYGLISRDYNQLALRSGLDTGTPDEDADGDCLLFSHPSEHATRNIVSSIPRYIAEPIFHDDLSAEMGYREIGRSFQTPMREQSILFDGDIVVIVGLYDDTDDSIGPRRRQALLMRF